MTNIERAKQLIQEALVLLDSIPDQPNKSELSQSPIKNFDYAYDNYPHNPRRRSRTDAEKAYKSCIKSNGKELEFNAAVNHYARSIQYDKDGTTYVKGLGPWVRSGLWEAWIKGDPTETERKDKRLKDRENKEKKKFYRDCYNEDYKPEGKESSLSSIGDIVKGFNKVML